MRLDGFTWVIELPDGSLSRGPTMSLGALLLGHPTFNGACPGYHRVGFALRVRGGWWRMKGQAVRP